MKTIEELRAALSKMHKRACGDTSQVYMSVPADPERDADLMLSEALTELAALRAGKAVIDKFAETGHTDMGRAAVMAIGEFYAAQIVAIKTEPLPLKSSGERLVFGCVHARPVGVPCPHCLGIGAGSKR